MCTDVVDILRYMDEHKVYNMINLFIIQLYDLDDYLDDNTKSTTNAFIHLCISTLRPAVVRH